VAKEAHDEMGGDIGGAYQQEDSENQSRQDGERLEERALDEQNAVGDKLEKEYRGQHDGDAQEDREQRVDEAFHAQAKNSARLKALTRKNTVTSGEREEEPKCSAEAQRTQRSAEKRETRKRGREILRFAQDDKGIRGDRCKGKRC
jgi:hypothetical protein